MKSVIAAAVLLVLTVIICICTSAHSTSLIDELYRLTESLPTETAEYEAAPQMRKQTSDTIGETWSDAVGYFSYVYGYNLLNRADEAVWNLYAAVNTGDYRTAVAARYQLLDALRRMKELEGISLSSVF